MVELSHAMPSHLNKNILEEFISLEEEIATLLAKLIRSSRYKHAENLAYGLSAFVNHDLWVLRKISGLGFEGFVKRLVGRGSKEFMEFIGYTMYLTFTWAASTVAVLGIVREYREENRDALAQWCKSYAREVEDYLDTLDILVNDEVYEELVELDVRETLLLLEKLVKAREKLREKFTEALGLTVYLITLLIEDHVNKPILGFYGEYEIEVNSIRLASRLH